VAHFNLALLLSYLHFSFVPLAEKRASYQIPVTQLKESKGNGDMEAANRDLNTPPTGGRQIERYGR